MRDADPVDASRSRRQWLLLLGQIVAGVLTLLLVPVAVNVWTGGSLPGRLARYNQDVGWAAPVLAVITVGLLAWLEALRRADSAAVGLGELLHLGSQRDEELARAEERRVRRVLLDQVHDQWIGGVLERSPTRLARVALGLAARSGAVANPWALALARPETAEAPLPKGMTIQELYAKHQRRLLLLGAPGSGKTTLLLELARDLLDQAVALLDAEPKRAAGEPLPVVFHLATWATRRRPLAAWLVEELQARYGLPARLARVWVAHQQVAPLLDGLDEVAEAHRGACVAAINQFAGDNGQLPIVVCCRTEEFDALATRVRLGGAVVIRPLGRAQIERWLRDGGRALVGVRAVLRDDQVLWELLDSPLLLSVMTLAYLGQPAAKIRAAGDVAERRRRLFGDFVAAMLARERTPVSRGWSYPPQQTLAWLGWLARMLRTRGLSVFYLDWVQPDWLPTRAQRWLVSYGIAIASGLIGGLVGGLAAGLSTGLAAGLLAGWPSG